MKKILSFVLAFCLCIPFAVAAVGCGKKSSSNSAAAKTIEVSSGTALAEAFKQAKDGYTIKLTEHLELTSLIQNSKNITLDLNGYSINLAGCNIINAGKLSIVNKDFSQKLAISMETRNGEDFYVYDPQNFDDLDSSEKSMAKTEAEVLEADKDTLADYGSFYLVEKGSCIYNGFTRYGDTSLGGAILNSSFDGKTGDLLVEGVAFVNCYASNGGAIANDGGATLMLKNVKAIGCKTSGYSTAGGFVYNNSTLSIDGLTAIACRCGNDKYDSYGGVIFNIGTAEIANSSFRFCEATDGSGGAICNGLDNDTNAAMTISGCTFKNFKAFHGGAIVNNNTITITDCEFSNGYASAGGCLFNTYLATINGGTTISDCSVENVGGAIFSDGCSTGNKLDARLILDDVVILDCTAPSHKSDKGVFYNESIYIRNASLEVRSGYIQNMIFGNDNPIGPLDDWGEPLYSQYYDDNFNGFPSCNIEITGGFFSETPKSSHVSGKCEIYTIDPNTTDSAEQQALQLGLTIGVRYR